MNRMNCIARCNDDDDDGDGGGGGVYNRKIDFNRCRQWKCTILTVILI